MENKLPLVSIVIPTYNQDKYIRQCIDSCLNQSYKNIEIIVVDDGSTDSTPQILSSYKDKIYLISQENQGAAKALNNGISKAKGYLVGWLSSDDAYLPEKTALQVAQFIHDTSLDISYTDYFSIDANGKLNKEVKSPFFDRDFLKNLLFGNFINGSSIIMKKSAWEEVGGFNTDLIADVDGEMWHKMLLIGKKFGHLQHTLVYYRTHSQNQSSNEPLMRHFSDIVICNTLMNAPDHFFDGGRGKEGLYDFYVVYIKHLYKCFFWSSALFVATRMNDIHSNFMNTFHILLNKILIRIFNTKNYVNNRRIIFLFMLRRVLLSLIRRKKISR